MTQQIILAYRTWRALTRYEEDCLPSFSIWARHLELDDPMRAAVETVGIDEFYRQHIEDNKS